jgi:outer membrane protein TolC
MAGCLHQAEFLGTSAAHAAAGTPCDTLPVIERGHLDIHGEGLTNPVPAPARRISYRGLTPEQCQCLAVQNAEMANMLDSERQGVAIQAAQLGCLRPHEERELPEMKESILFHAAQEIRNRNAGAALELYYHLAEAEAKSALVEKSAEILQDLSKMFQQMKSKGLRLPIDYETLTRQQIDLQIQRTQLQLAIDQLNGDLIRLLGLNGCAPDERLWPVADFMISSQPVDVEAAVIQGLAQRPELVLLREVEQKLNAQTLPAVRQLAGSFQALLGMMDQRPRSLLVALLLRRLSGSRPELEIQRQQLQQHLAEQEKAVAQEIRQAARTLIAQQQLAALNRQKVQSWETGIRELEDRNRQGMASSTEVAMGKLDWLRARGDLVKEIMAWHIARGKLKQAQGVLPSECADSRMPCP